MLLGRWGFGAPKWSIPERKHMPKRPRSDGAMSVGRSLSPQLVCNGGHQRADARQKHKSETREDEQYRQRPSPTENFSCVVYALPARTIQPAKGTMLMAIKPTTVARHSRRKLSISSHQQMNPLNSPKATRPYARYARQRSIVSGPLSFSQRLCESERFASP